MVFRYVVNSLPDEEILMGSPVPLRLALFGGLPRLVKPPTHTARIAESDELLHN